MNVYIETNFVLELALLQEQHESCRAILDLAADKRIQLIIPAYCLIEPNETVARRHRQRKQRKAELDEELRQLARNVQNRDRLEGFHSSHGAADRQRRRRGQASPGNLRRNL